MNQQIVKNKIFKFLYKKQTELYIYFSQIKNENININDIETLKQIFNNAKQEKYIKHYSILSITNKKNIIIDYGISYNLNNNYNHNYYLTLRENLYLKNKIQYFYINKHIIKYWLFSLLFIYFINHIAKQLIEQLANKEYRLRYYRDIIDNSENYIPDYISGVYIIINKVNLKVYIGSSLDIKSRKNQHLKLLSRGIHGNNHLQGAIVKYGIENFYFKILEICENENEYKNEDKGESENESEDKDKNINIIDILRKKEQYYLYYYNANNPHCGYNQYKIEKCLNNRKNRKSKRMNIKYFNEWADLYVNHNMSIRDIVSMYDNVYCATTIGRILKSGGVKLRDCYSDIYREKQVKGLAENNKKKWDKWNELYNNGDGLKCKEIAEIYKVSENNVKEKLKKIYGCNIKKKEMEKIGVGMYKGKHLHYKLKWEELYKSGLSILKIAKMYNVGHKVVKKVLEIELLKDIKGEKNIHNPYKKGFYCFNEEAEYKKEREGKRRRKQELWGKIRELWKQGKSDNEIANVCCLPVKKVYDYLKSYRKNTNKII